jgi:hypothetical protein
VQATAAVEHVVAIGPAGHRRRSRLPAVVLLVVGLTLAGVATAGLAGVRLPIPGRSGADARWGPPRPLTGAAVAQLPTRLRIPAIGVDTALEELDLGPDGALTAPTDFAQAGWYVRGPVPGDPGPAVLAGHVDSTHGPAVFYHLRELKPGAQVLVDRGGQWFTFTVVDVQRYPKGKFPTARVYGPTPGAELRLVTCGGVFDRRAHSYEDNVVAYAIAGTPTR